MDAERFWELIGHIDQAALQGGEEEQAVEPLIAALAGCEAGEITGFEETLAQKLHAIDGPKWADNAGTSGGSGDGFLYIRCHVVARGQATYDEVLADPKKMPRKSSQWCEPLLSVAMEAWSSSQEREWDFFPSVDYESFSNEANWL